MTGEKNVEIETWERLGEKTRKINRHLWRWGSFAWDMRKTIQKRRNSLVGEEKYFRKKNKKNFLQFANVAFIVNYKVQTFFLLKGTSGRAWKISTSWASFLLFLFFCSQLHVYIIFLHSALFFTTEFNIFIFILSELTVSSIE